MNRQRAVARMGVNPRTKKELEVLSVASDYFLSHGYRGTSINAMARDSGISKESIYRYFSSKKELFEAVIAKELTQYQKKLNSVDFEIETISLELALRKMGESILGAVSTDRTIGLRRLIFQEARESPDIGQFYYEIGPMRGYRNLQKIFEFHATKSRLGPEKLSHYFLAMLLHHRMLMRQCGVLKPFSKKEMRAIAVEVTEDFTKAFLR